MFLNIHIIIGRTQVLKTKKTILVAPLFWGLGHATRCIPIIRALLEHNFDVLLGSDGAALSLLKKEFPTLPSIELPAYNISYPKNGDLFKIKMLFMLPHFKKTMDAEKKLIENLVKEGTIHGVISDNRLGIRSKKLPSVIITHQVNVLSGNTSYFSSKLHQIIIKKFDACWVPDVEGEPNLSGILGHPKQIDFPLTYIGPLSRMKVRQIPKKYDYLVLLSGPEPQRTMLEVKLMDELMATDKKVLLVRGVAEAEQKTYENENLTIVNFLTSKELERAINESDLVISRSGYTTIMDLAAMEKNAFFIPTPGQYEQKYLAKQLKKRGIAPYCRQENFTLKKLKYINTYKGFKKFDYNTPYEGLFALFEGK